LADDLLSYLNGSLYISVEISGFTGTETRGQLNLQLSYRLWVRLVLARGTLAMFNYDETRTWERSTFPHWLSAAVQT